MTIYNPGDYLKIAIESLVNQSYQNWELIAIENGSSDSSLAILTSYSDPRIKIHKMKRNIGRTPALIFALNNARGEYVAILDADDLALKGRLACQVSYLDDNVDVALVASYVQYIDGNGKLTGEIKPPIHSVKLLESLAWTNCIAHSSVMYRRVLAINAGGYSPDFAIIQDYGLILSLTRYGRITVIDQFLCQLRVLNSSMSRTPINSRALAEELVIAYQRAQDILLLSPRTRRLNKRSISVAKIRLGSAIFRNKEYFTGAYIIFKELIINPSVLWGNGVIRRYFGGDF